MWNETLTELQSSIAEFPPIKGRRGALQVHESLRDDILWLRIKPGSAIDELALAERFEVSRTPIREALLLLSSEGFVEFLLNRTTIVAPFSMDNAGAYFDTLLVLSRAVARTAAIRGAARIDQFHEHIERYCDAVAKGDHETALKARHAFFLHLSSQAANVFQDRFFRQILDAGVRMCVLHYFTHATAAELGQSAEKMKELARAVAASAPDRSDQCAADMIRADIAIIMRSLQPRAGYELDLSR